MQPQRQDIIAIGSLEDLFTACFVVIDDLYGQFTPREVMQRPGPPPSLTDAEVITIALVGELFGMEVEGRWYSLVWQHYQRLFPGLNERSRFNRRRRNLWQVSNLLRQRLMETLVDPNDPWRILDSFPLVVANWGRRSRVSLARGEGGFGKAYAKQCRFFGYRVHLLIRLQGVVTNLVLAPANAHDSTVAPEIFQGMEGLIGLGDKAYAGLPLQTELAQHQIQLLALRRKDSRKPLPQALAKLVRRARQLIETVGSQLTQVFHLEHNLAKSTWGIKTRLIDKLLAHSMGCSLNHLLGRPLLHMAGLVYH
jgi:hypothetical protein